jgi:hypothetical protein
MEMPRIRGPLLRGRKSGYSPVKMTNLWLCDDLFPWRIVYHFVTKPHSASKAASSSLMARDASPGYPAFDPVVLSHCPHTVGLSRTLLIAPLTKIRLLFQVCNAGGKPAYPFCGTCYDDSPLLYPYSRGKPASILSRRTSYRRMLQASILTNLVSPVPSVMITVSRLALCDRSAKCADSPRDVQSPFQLPILGPLRLHLCPA